jgi:hypothetical protein
VSEQNALYRLVEGQSEIVVYPDGVEFRTMGDLPLEPVRIHRDSLVAVSNYANRDLWLPDVVVVIFRSPEGLKHFTWPLTTKGVCREVSNAIYRVIEHGVRKSFVGFLYTMTHRIDIRFGL